MSPARVRIAFVIESLEIGGTEGQLVELVSRLDRQRFEPVVVCLSSSGPLVSKVSAPVELIGFPRGRGGGARSRRLLDARLPRSLGRLWKALRRHRPHIIHGELFWSNALATLVGRAAGVPLVVTSRRGPDGRRGSGLRYRAVRRLANRLCDLVIANCVAMRVEAVRGDPGLGDRLIVIENGVDCAAFDGIRRAGLRQALGIEAADRVVIAVANLLPYKGHAHLLDAWAALVRAVPCVRLLLVGDGPLRAELGARVVALGLDASVRFLGIRREEIPALLALADVVVHPSTEEGMPNVVLEAMAVGRPVVATCVGGTPEVVVDGETGLLVPPADPDALRAALAWLLEHPEEAHRFGVAGRRRAADRFSIDRMVARHEAMYEDLVAGRRPARGTT